jgi:hypothetical protein
MYPYAADTSSDAEDVLLELTRRTAPTDRVMKSLRMSSRLIRECKAAISRNNPGLTQREIDIAFIEYNYGKELATAVDQYQTEVAHG